MYRSKRSRHVHITRERYSIPSVNSESHRTVVPYLRSLDRKAFDKVVLLYRAYLHEVTVHQSLHMFLLEVLVHHPAHDPVDRYVATIRTQLLYVLHNPPSPLLLHLPPEHLQLVRRDQASILLDLSVPLSTRSGSDSVPSTVTQNHSHVDDSHYPSFDDHPDSPGYNIVDVSPTLPQQQLFDTAVASTLSALPPPQETTSRLRRLVCQTSRGRTVFRPQHDDSSSETEEESSSSDDDSPLQSSDSDDNDSFDIAAVTDPVILAFYEQYHDPDTAVEVTRDDLNAVDLNSGTRVVPKPDAVDHRDKPNDSIDFLAQQLLNSVQLKHDLSREITRDFTSILKSVVNATRMECRPNETISDLRIDGDVYRDLRQTVSLDREFPVPVFKHALCPNVKCKRVHEYSTLACPCTKELQLLQGPQGRPFEGFIRTKIQDWLVHLLQDPVFRSQVHDEFEAPPPSTTLRSRKCSIVIVLFPSRGASFVCIVFVVPFPPMKLCNTFPLIFLLD